MPDIAELLERLSKLTGNPVIYFAGGDVEINGVQYKYSQDSIGVVVSQILLAIRSSITSLLFLSRADIDCSKADCLMIARGIVEGCINVSYVITKGDDVAQKSIKHAFVRGYKRNDRTIGNLTLKRNIPITDPMQKIMSEFINKKGYVQDWTNVTAIKRIVEIEKVYGHKMAHLLNTAYLMIYSDASEIIHGSLAGSQLRNGTISFNEHDASKGYTSEYYASVNQCHIENAIYGSFWALLSTSYILCEYGKLEEYKNQIDSIYTEFLVVFDYKSA